MKKILVPIDFSPTSKNALLYAASLGAERGAEVHLFHAYTPTTIEPYMAVYMQRALIDQQEELALHHFAELKNDLPASLQKAVTLSFSLAMGPVVEEILAYGNTEAPDLIVMGMRGGNHLAKKILGSSSLGVIQRAHQPILIVPDGASFKGLHKLAYATNYEEEDTDVLDYLLNFANPFQAVVHCLHIRTKDTKVNEYREEILKKAYQYDLSMDKLDFETLTYDTVVKGINQYTQDQQVDILAMLTHQRGIFSQLFHKSHTKDVAIRTQVPLLVFQKGAVPA